jgi:hypothetical protein
MCQCLCHRRMNFRRTEVSCFPSDRKCIAKRGGGEPADAKDRDRHTADAKSCRGLQGMRRNTRNK